MARTNKKGLVFFQFNVDFFEDDKIQLIESEFGLKGSYIAVRLLCKIYKMDYFYQWGDDQCLLFSKSIGNGIVPNLVAEVVNGLVKRGFFDKAIFDSFGILTSKGIQNRFFDAVIRYKKVDVIREYLLVDVSKMINVYINSINVYINPINDSICTHKDKDKEIDKEREIKKITPTGNPVINLDLLKDKMLIPISECEEEMLCDEITLNATAMHYHLDPDLVEIRKWVKSFFSTQRSRGEKEVTLKDSRKYFSDWLNVQLVKQNKQSKSNITNLTGHEVYTKF